jgi:hypothetical protein
MQLAKAIVGLGIFAAVGGVGFLAGRLRKLPPNTMAYSAEFVGWGVLSALFSAFIAYGGLSRPMTPAEPDFLPWIGLLVAFPLGSAYFLALACNWRLAIEDGGLRYRSLLRQERTIAWTEVSRIRPRWWSNALVVELLDGSKIGTPEHSPLGPLLVAEARRAGVACRLPGERP